ncbi:hypothetical protein [Streptomyces sp. NPDC058613]|uniref:hypothetical protein n=1 Tax=Streptomyces sp. NPDC058613 TaxID=3346556 RepID=UPI003664C669
MDHCSQSAIVFLALAVDVLFCLLVAALTGVLARVDGATTAVVLTRAGVAFAGAFTLSLALVTFLTTAIR